MTYGTNHHLSNSLKCVRNTSTGRKKFLTYKLNWIQAEVKWMDGVSCVLKIATDKILKFPMLLQHLSDTF